MKLFGDILPFIGFKSLWYTTDSFAKSYPTIAVPEEANVVLLEIFALGWFGYELGFAYKLKFLQIDGED